MSEKWGWVWMSSEINGASELVHSRSFLSIKSMHFSDRVNNLTSADLETMADATLPKRKAESDARGNGDSKRSKVRALNFKQSATIYVDVIFCPCTTLSLCIALTRGLGQEEVGDAKKRKC